MERGKERERQTHRQRAERKRQMIATGLHRCEHKSTLHTAFNTTSPDTHTHTTTQPHTHTHTHTHPHTHTHTHTNVWMRDYTLTHLIALIKQGHTSPRGVLLLHKHIYWAPFCQQRDWENSVPQLKCSSLCSTPAQSPHTHTHTHTNRTRPLCCVPFLDLPPPQPPSQTHTHTHSLFLSHAHTRHM